MQRTFRTAAPPPSPARRTTATTTKRRVKGRTLVPSWTDAGTTLLCLLGAKLAIEKGARALAPTFLPRTHDFWSATLSAAGLRGPLRPVLLGTGPLTAPLLASVAIALAWAVAVTVHIDLGARAFAWLYRRGQLQRSTPLPDKSEHYGALRAEFVIQFPPVFLLMLALPWVARRLAWTFDPAGMVLTVLATALVKDAWFYHGHLLMHRVRWLYRLSHACHHEDHPVNMWTIGHADAAEYLLAAMPSHLFLTAAMLAREEAFNVPTWVFTQWTLTCVEILGHCGYKPSLWLACFWPPIALGRLIPGTQSAQTHEAHHRFVNGNFALLFRHWDRIYGTDIKGT